MLAEHELPGTARHDPLAYLQNRTVDWLDHQLAARELLQLDVANTHLVVEHEYPKARIQDRERLKPILQGSIAFVRRIDEAAACMYALQHEVLAAQDIPIQGIGREAVSILSPNRRGNVPAPPRPSVARAGARSMSQFSSSITRRTLRLGRRVLFALAAAALLFAGVQASSGGGQATGGGAARPLKVLLLGEGDATHSTTALFTSLAPVLARHGIQLTHVSTTGGGAHAARCWATTTVLLIYGDHGDDHAGAGEGAGRLRRGRQGLIALNCRRRDVPVVGHLRRR